VSVELVPVEPVTGPFSGICDMKNPNGNCYCTLPDDGHTAHEAWGTDTILERW